MSVACATSLGGSLKLRLEPDAVTATLHVPLVKIECSQHYVDFDIADLRTAVVEDSALQRKMWARRIEGAFVSGNSPPVLAGDSKASIEAFASDVISTNADVVFIDQNFGGAHTTVAGTDVVRDIRARDAASGAAQRLIYVVSAADAPDDLAHYGAFLQTLSCLRTMHLLPLYNFHLAASGATGHIAKTISTDQLHARVCQHASAELRFRGRLVRRTSP